MSFHGISPSVLVISLEWTALSEGLRAAIVRELGPKGSKDTHSTREDGSLAVGGPKINRWNSYPIDTREVGEILDGVEAKTVALLKRMANNFDPHMQRCWVSWPEAKAVTGSRNYDHFARGRLGGLHKRIRSVTGDKKAILLWSFEEGEEGYDWKWDEKANDYTEGTGFLDGPAALALRDYFGMR